ncbi:MAG: DUF3048 domain-containing protein [Pontimonas sp.]
MSMSPLTLGAYFSAFALVLSGCAAQPEPVEDQVVEIIEEVVEPEVPRHPLTGFELGSSKVSGPSIAVKIDNTSSGRPQVGIAAADIVFEELVEGGVTRYLAVFHSAIPEEVGPVRSGRPQDADLVRSLGGVFVFSGVGNANVREIIRGTGLQLVEHDTSGGTPDGEYFFRSSRKPAPWNLHISASDLAASYTSLDSPAQQFSYVSDPSQAAAVVLGDDAQSIQVGFSTGVESIWEWDEPTGTYLKFLSNGSPDTDADGTQIAATNVLVFTPNYFDVEGLPSAKIAGTRESAIIFTGGKTVSAIFDASVLGEPIRLLDGEDQPLSLSPGKTFILLPPGAGSTASGVTPGFVTYESNGETVTRNI